MNWFKSKPLRTVLGLTLDGGRIEAVLLRRTNGSATIVKSHSAALTLDLLHNEVELVGREIHNQLAAAGIRERRCVVGVPAAWVLTAQTKLPDLPGEDADSFLELEAERGLPCALEDLQVAVSRFRAPGGAEFATHLAVRRDHLSRLEQVLAAAQLKPAGFSLALTAVPGALAEAAQGVITASVTEAGVDLLVAHGGVVAVRSIEGAFDAEGGERRVQGDLVARELRITLGQLPEELRPGITRLQVVGAGHFAQQLAAEIRRPAEALGLAVEQVGGYAGPHHGIRLPLNAPVSPALSIAAEQVGSGRPRFQFRPPKPTVWEQISTRYNSRKLGWVGATAGGAALIVCGLFLFQQIQLSSLRSEWNAMRPKVSELDDTQARIKKFRPWFDASLTSLSILKRVTEAFPADGVVAAKTFEIRGGAAVSVSGTARDNPALLKTLDQLRAAKEVAGVKVEQIRGKTPMQFTFDFNWTGGGAP
jgi:Tfp pilus assembly PilM family ATPase